MAGVVFDKDPVHSLQVNDVNIHFGKYSKNGIMMVSQKGTVLDVAMPTNLHTEEVYDMKPDPAQTWKNIKTLDPNKKDKTTVPIMKEQHL